MTNDEEDRVRLKIAMRAGIEMAAKVADNFADVTTDRVKWTATRIAKEIRELLDSEPAPELPIPAAPPCSCRLANPWADHRPGCPQGLTPGKWHPVGSCGLSAGCPRCLACCHGTRGCPGQGDKHACAYEEVP